MCTALRLCRTPAAMLASPSANIRTGPQRARYEARNDNRSAYSICGAETEFTGR